MPAVHLRQAGAADSQRREGEYFRVPANELLGYFWIPAVAGMTTKKEAGMTRKKEAGMTTKKGRGNDVQETVVPRAVSGVCGGRLPIVTHARFSFIERSPGVPCFLR
jgi:hypothetical protein